MQMTINTGKIYVTILANEHLNLPQLEEVIRVLNTARRHIKKEARK